MSLVKKLTDCQRNLRLRLLNNFDKNSENIVLRKNDSLWKNTSSLWGFYSSPFRPSLSDINNYSVAFERVAIKKKVLILGATPELRDMLFDLNIEIVVVDFSIKMIEGMTEFCKNQVKEREKWEKLNWLDLDKSFGENKFDVVFGDLVLRNIDLNYQDKFLKVIAGLIKKGGYFITRTHFLNELAMTLNEKEIIQFAFEESVGLENAKREDLITSRLFDKNRDANTKRVKKEKFLNDIENYFENYSKNKGEKRILKNILIKWAGYNNWTQINFMELDKKIKKYFLLKDSFLADDYNDSEFYPTYSLENK